MLVAFSPGDAAHLALAVFFLAVGLGVGYAFLKLGTAFAHLSSFIGGTERELLPVISKVGGSVDRVNAQLDKLDQATDSAVDAVESVDQAVRAVSFAVKRPVQKATGFTSGVSHGFATLRKKRDWRQAMQSAKEASARREADLEEDLRRPRP
ncbi:MAG: hypothetical protein WCH31_03275 [Actinomycetes bacterium]